MAEAIHGNIFVRDNKLTPEAPCVVTHAHNFHHVSYVHSGWAHYVKYRPLVSHDGSVVTKDGEAQLVEVARGVIGPGEALDIEPHEYHRFDWMPAPLHPAVSAYLDAMRHMENDETTVLREELLAALQRGPTVVHCVYAHRDHTGIVTDVYRGNEEAYR